MTDAYSGSERWRVADWTAAFLFVDRDVCRKAFYREPAWRIAEAVKLARSRKSTSDQEREEIITRWAIENYSGVYHEDRPYGGLVKVGEFVLDSLAWLEERRPEMDPLEEYSVYLELVRIKERKLGRALLASELDRFTRKFYAISQRRCMEGSAVEADKEFEAELEN